MAKVFKFTDGTNTLDLSNSTGFQLMQEYRPQVAIPPGDGSIPEYISETVPVTLNNSGGDNLAGFLQTFHALQKRAAEYWQDSTQGTPVWWHQKLDDETGERRALVKSLEFRTDFNWFGDRPDIEDGVDAVLVVERHPYWERTATVNAASSSSLSGASVLYDPTSATDVVGDIPARIENLVFSLSAADPLDRFWMGMRSTKNGVTPGNFQNIWECEDGTLGTNAATSSDGTASGGSKVVVTPGTATWAKRLTISLGSAGGGSDDIGRFLWLLRCYITAGTWEVQFRFGYYDMADDNYQVAEIVEVDNTGWDYHAMGQAMIPLTGQRQSPLGTVADWQIQVWARRTSGSGNLHLDCFCPIPIDEGYLVISGANNGSGTLNFQMFPREEILVSRVFTTVKGLCPYESSHFLLPVGDVRIVCVFARASSSDLTDAFNFLSSPYYPRWLSLRGSE